MKLVIAEKPSVAQSLAAVLGAKERGQGYLQGNGYIVSWCVGHLIGLAAADSYDPKYSKPPTKITNGCEKKIRSCRRSNPMWTPCSVLRKNIRKRNRNRTVKAEKSWKVCNSICITSSFFFCFE